MNKTNCKLKELKEQQFLTKRIFERISENMHYEIFKNLDCKDLLTIRLLNQGGYQLTSNTILRSRIKNYFPKLKLFSFSKSTMNFINLLFEQSGEKKKLYFSNLKDQEIGELIKAIPHINKIEKLNLANKKIESDTFEKLISKLKLVPQLTENTGILSSNIGKLANHLQYLPNLKRLNLGEIIIQAQDLYALTENFKFIKKLEKLNSPAPLVFAPNSGLKGAKFLSESFKFLPNLKKLNLSNQKFDFEGEGVKLILQNLSYLINLEYLKLDGMGIGANINLFYEKLQFLPHLISLDLHFNRIQPLSSINFANYLKFIPNLQELDLSSNFLREKGAEEIAENLKHIPKLKYFYLVANNILDNGAQAIARNLNYVPNLIKLYLSLNEIQESGAITLANNLKYIPRLEILNLRANKVGLKGIRAIAEELEHLHHLRILYISGMVNVEEDEEIYEIARRMGIKLWI